MESDRVRPPAYLVGRATAVPLWGIEGSLRTLPRSRSPARFRESGLPAIHRSRPHDQSRQPRVGGYEDSSTRVRGPRCRTCARYTVDRHRLRDAGIHLRPATGDLGMARRNPIGRRIESGPGHFPAGPRGSPAPPPRSGKPHPHLPKRPPGGRVNSISPQKMAPVFWPFGYLPYCVEVKSEGEGRVLTLLL
jgi:hypothetical protein